MPNLLTSPPWTRPAEKPAVPSRAIRLSAIEAPDALTFAPGERDEWRAAIDPLRELTCYDGGCQECLVAAPKLKRRLGYGEHSRAYFERLLPATNVEKLALFGIGFGPPDLVVASWNAATDDALKRHQFSSGANGYLWLTDTIRAAVAESGEAMLPNFVRIQEIHLGSTNYATLLGPTDGTRAGRVAFALLSRGKKMRQIAEAWAHRHPRSAALVAVPAALAGDAASSTAVDLLRFLVARGHRPIVAAVVEEYGGGDVAAELDRAVGLDPLTHFPAKLPKLPAFFEPERLPALTDVHGAAISTDGVRNLGIMLAFSRLDLPYAGLAEIRRELSPDSRRAFAWALFEAWLAAGAPPKEMWALHQLGHLGDDESVRRLAPLVRGWPGEKAAARAVEGLRAIGAIGSDLALLTLHTIAEKSKFASIRETAKEMMDRIAEERGLSRDDLADRLTPDLGVDARGTISFDWGTRQFVVGFDEALRPVVRDASGKVLADMPKPAKSDDAARAKAALAAFKALKADVRAIASAAITRMEKAMITKRRWSAADHAFVWIDKPLLRTLARRVVWGEYDDDVTDRPSRLFLVTEDGTLTDRDDRTVSLAPGARVGIPHRLDLDESSIVPFGQRLADYELVQPFPQLARTTFRPTPDELSGPSLDRWRGKTFSATALVFGLEARGWRRGLAFDGGAFTEHTKRFGEETAVVSYSGAVAMGYIEPTEVLTLERVSFARRQRLDEVAPIFVSEVERDLAELSAS